MILRFSSGRRRWSIEHKFLSETQEKRREIPRSATRLLKNFVPDEEWELNPGDMLYLPPRIPHQGKYETAVFGDDCVFFFSF